MLMLWLLSVDREGIWGPGGLLACAYLNDHVRLLKRYHVKCLMPALFLPLGFAYQSIPDPELPYTFLRRWHPVGKAGHLLRAPMIHHCNIPVLTQVQKSPVILIKKTNNQSHFFIDADSFDSCHKIYL